MVGGIGFYVRTRGSNGQGSSAGGVVSILVGETVAPSLPFCFAEVFFYISTLQSKHIADSSYVALFSLLGHLLDCIAYVLSAICLGR